MYFCNLTRSSLGLLLGNSEALLHATGRLTPSDELHQLQTRILWCPQVRKNFQGSEAHRVIERPCLVIGRRCLLLRDRLHLQNVSASLHKPVLGMSHQCFAMPLSPRIGSDRHAVHLPRLGEVFAQCQKSLELFSTLNGEGRQRSRVGDISNQRLFNAEPLGYRAKNRFALILRIEIRADYPRRCLHAGEPGRPLCGQFGNFGDSRGPLWVADSTGRCNTLNTHEKRLIRSRRPIFLSTPVAGAPRPALRLPDPGLR